MADQADLVDGLGRLLDYLATEGRAIVSDVPVLDGDGVDAFAQRRGFLILSLLMLDLDSHGDRSVDDGVAVEEDRTGRGVCFGD
ncbi:MAG: hypothetical protein AcusKO_10800 [Acuticoccus sp.]